MHDCVTIKTIRKSGGYMDFAPFKNDSQSLTVGAGNGLTFENGTDSIKIYGDTEITPKSSAKDIDEMIALLQAIKQGLAHK
jgi:hypothetical protein